MKGLLQLLIALVISGSVYGQKPLMVNGGVDTSGADVKKAIHFYRQYLDEFKNWRQPDYKKYWSKEDCEKYKCPDPIVYGIAGDGATYSFGYDPTILYVKPEAGYIHIKTSFANADSLQNISTLCITNHYIRFDGQGNPQFVSPVEINCKAWQTRKVRNVTYWFPPYHTFDAKKADSLASHIAKLEKDWSLTPIDIRYYFANSADEFKQIRGFDYMMGMGNKDKPSGVSNADDNLIYCAGLGENYFHEVVHVYLHSVSPKFPTEGFAVFYGGSLGHELKWHIPKLKAYLDNHPEIDLEKDFHALSSIDSYTNGGSVIEGLLCQSVYKKDGVEGFKRIVKYDSINELLEKEFHIAADNRNTFLREMVAGQ